MKDTSIVWEEPDLLMTKVDGLRRIVSSRNIDSTTNKSKGALVKMIPQSQQNDEVYNNTYVKSRSNVSIIYLICCCF